MVCQYLASIHPSKRGTYPPQTRPYLSTPTDLIFEGVSMNLRNAVLNKWQKVILISILFLSFSYIFAFGQTSSAPISFTKKEVAFFKWGEIDKKNPISKEYSRFYPKVLHIDGYDNLYFVTEQSQIFIVPSDGSPVKKNSLGKAGGVFIVDEEGNCYSSYYKKGEPWGFILTKPDGSQTEYKNFNLDFEENGIIYDLKNNKALTITDHGTKPEKLPPRLFITKGETNLKINYPNSFTIYTEKINKHLKKINRRIDSDKIRIKIEEKNDVKALANLIGIDDDGNSYFFCAYQSQVRDGPWNEADVMVYSQKGQKIAEIPLELNFYDKQAFYKEVVSNIRGDIFQMWASEDGVHISKWTKN